MGLLIRRPNKSKINYHHHSHHYHHQHKENREFVPNCKKMQSLDHAESSPRNPKDQFPLDGDLVSEVMKHMDGRTLARASCVNKLWNKTAQDEKLWETICLRYWKNIGCGSQQLRSVVLALGGFRRLYSLCLWPMLSPSSSAPLPFSPFLSSRVPTRRPSAKTQSWGKDEVNLSLSLYSIHCYEKMVSAPLHSLSSTHLQSAKHPIFEDPTQTN